MLLQPLGFVVFVVAAFAEAGRLPFDLPEGEQELVGGYHTEYSGMKLVLFLTAEFLHMITAVVPDRDPVPRRLAFPGSDSADVAGRLTWWMAILRVVVLLMQDRAGDLVLHAGPLELAAVSLRPADGAGLEGHVAAGVAEPGGRARCCSELQHPDWLGDSPGAGLAWLLAGWVVVLAGWLVVGLISPLVADNRPRRDLQTASKSIRRL